MATTDVTITITTPTGVSISQAVDTLSTYWGYQATIPDPVNPGQTIPNPQTKGQFVKQRIARFVKDSYLAAKAGTEGEDAKKAVITAADAVQVT